MTDYNKKINVFNSALEIGSRTAILLCAIYPDKLDIQQIINLDYLMIHSGDAGGPESLHTPVPHRSGELLVKQDLIQRGIYLMMSRGLIRQLPEKDGFKYIAGEDAENFVSSLQTEYYRSLKERTRWVLEKYRSCSSAELNLTVTKFFDSWGTQFQSLEKMEC